MSRRGTHALLLLLGCASPAAEVGRAAPDGALAADTATPVEAQLAGSTDAAPDSTARDAPGDPATAADVPAPAGARSHLFFLPSGGLARFHLEECPTSGACPGGLPCLRMTPELAVCDLPRPVASTCTPPDRLDAPDECGCAGRTCGPGALCTAIEKTCSCLPPTHNACVPRACQSPADCPAAVCAPSMLILSAGGRCLAGCTSDASCTQGTGGRCALMMRPPNQGGETTGQMGCAYPCLAGSGCDPTTLCGGKRGVPLEGYTATDPTPYYGCL